MSFQSLSHSLFTPVINRFSLVLRIYQHSIRLGAGEDVRLPAPRGFLPPGEVVYGDNEAASYINKNAETSVATENDNPAVPPRGLKPDKKNGGGPAGFVRSESFEIIP